MDKKTARELLSTLESIAVLVRSAIEKLEPPEVVVSDDVRQRVERLMADHRCLFCGESLDDKESPKRGLHRRCYMLARARIQRGETTEEALVLDGRLGPHGKSGRRRKEIPSSEKLNEIASTSVEDADPDEPEIVKAALEAARKQSRTATKKPAKR